MIEGRCRAMLFLMIAGRQVRNLRSCSETAAIAVFIKRVNNFHYNFPHLQRTNRAHYLARMDSRINLLATNYICRKFSFNIPGKFTST